MAVFFALACLVCSACNDFVFKAFARKPRSLGYFMAVIGAVGAIPVLFFRFDPAADLRATLLWGTLGGILSVTSNILLLEAMGRESAGMCSTIFRLNMVAVVVGAALILHEDISLMQYAGIFLALLAVVGFIPAQQGGGGRLQLSTGFMLVVCASLLRAAMTLVLKHGLNCGAERNAIVLLTDVCWIVFGLLFAFFRERERALPEQKVVRYGIGSGILVFGILIFTTLMLQYGNVSVVQPIAQMSFLLTFVLSRIFFKEPFSWRKLAALFAGVGAIVLLAM